MSGVIVAAAVVLILATYVAALSRALLTVSRTSLTRRLEASGRGDDADWLMERLEPTRLAAALLRTIMRVTFIVFVLIEFAGTGEDATLTVTDVIVAAVISILGLWLTTTVIGTSLARYAATGLVSGGLPLLKTLYIVCLPLTRGLAFIDEAIRRLSGANLAPQEEAEAELLRSIDETHREGGLDERSAALLENVVEFSSTDVGEVMTPRTDIDGIELTDDITAIRSFINEVGHSRIPVYEGNLDHIVGVLYVKDLVPYLGEDASDFTLAPILRQPIVVPETKPVRELLGDFQRSEVHMAVVIDEYGGTAGLVTIEDVLEEIVGEIQDEHDADDDETPALLALGDGRAEVDGRFHIDDLNEHLGLSLPEDEEYDTVAGYLLARLGHVPTVGETIEADEARFTALAATPTHVQRIGIELLENGARG